MSGLVLVRQIGKSISDDSDSNSAGIAINSTIVSDKRPLRLPPPRSSEQTSTTAHWENVMLGLYSLINLTGITALSSLLIGSTRKVPSEAMTGRTISSYSALLGGAGVL